MNSSYIHHTYTRKKNNKNTIKWNFTFTFSFLRRLGSHRYSSYTHAYTQKRNISNNNKKTTIKWNFPFCFYFFRGLANHIYSLYTHHTYTQKKTLTTTTKTIKTPNEILASAFTSSEVWQVTCIHHTHIIHTSKKRNINNSKNNNTIIKWNFTFNFYFFRGLGSFFCRRLFFWFFRLLLTFHFIVFPYDDFVFHFINVIWFWLWTKMKN